MSRLKRAFYLQGAGLALGVLLAAWVLRNVPVAQYIGLAQQRIGQMELWGPALYPLLYALCNVLLLPGGIIAMGGGLFFGLWWGFALILTGNVLGAAIAFFISRKLGRGWLEKRFFRHHKWVVIDELIARDGWKIIFLSQVHPLFPSSLLNYLYGITRIRCRTCLLWVALGQAPGLFLYAYLGTLAQLGLNIWQGKTHPHWHEYLTWGAGLLLSLVVTAALSRTALRILSEAEAKAAQRLQEGADIAGHPAQQNPVPDTGNPHRSV